MEFDKPVKRSVANSNPSKRFASVPKESIEGKDQLERINFYLEPQFGTISLDEAEDLFRQRLKAMSIILENHDVKSQEASSINHMLKAVKSDLFPTNCVSSLLLNLEQKRLDNISHFLARMYFAFQPECEAYRNFERRFLEIRLRELDCFSGQRLAHILEYFGFEYELASLEEIAELAKERYVNWTSPIDVKSTGNIFKVKFEHAIKFIARRSVGVKDGYALLTVKEIVSVICDAFDQHIEKSLVSARRALSLNPNVQHLYEGLDLVYKEFKESETERLRKLKQVQSGEGNPHSLDMSNIEEIVKQHYPPCMRYIHESLRQDHHLRHQARLYYITFLRNCGVDLDTSIEFWREEFTKKIPNDKFERDYKYNIRHLYGKEGQKKAISSFTCEKMIKDNPPGPVDKHGCPFKHFDDTHLVSMLKKHNLEQHNIDSILLAKKNNDQVDACCKYFKYTKGKDPSGTIRKPVQFYYESMHISTSETTN